ncbi:response regulator [Sphingomonas daechungensis]|uniref:Response regulator n=1 Tax=Sphingomonas daechungensis TaxID=1176646 RepID=A0ABX6T002_9SPHN|nr:response regulator [Sphingomonas daechungensis]QNP43157.1 response regulator [Sphingomonas daechungensis]
MSSSKVIAVVDDDESVRESLPALLESYGFEVRAFESAEAFLRADGQESTDCIVLDVAMPGLSGPQLQQALIRNGFRLPIVFISAHAQDNLWPTLQSSGAIACLLKPFSEEAIVEAVTLAVRPK